MRRILIAIIDISLFMNVFMSFYPPDPFRRSCSRFPWMGGCRIPGFRVPFNSPSLLSPRITSEDLSVENYSGTCPRLSLPHGKIKYRSRGRIARFSCDYGYSVVGTKIAACLRGRWDSSTPICVGRNCGKLRAPLNGNMAERQRGVILFRCIPGYRLVGPPSVYCTGMLWNDTTPICQRESLDTLPNEAVCNQTTIQLLSSGLASASSPNVFLCDFEIEGSCGWFQDTKDDNFDWLRLTSTTPSNHIGTGPSTDHTPGKNGKGHYLYIEASSPRKENDTARIYSPVFPQSCSMDSCFSFWFHMYGKNTGTLRVFVKPESVGIEELSPAFLISGNQGDQWFRGTVIIPAFNEPFQIILDGIRGGGYSSDIAIDDIGLLFGTQCSDVDDVNATSVPDVTASWSISGDDGTSNRPPTIVPSWDEATTRYYNQDAGAALSTTGSYDNSTSTVLQPKLPDETRASPTPFPGFVPTTSKGTVQVDTALPTSVIPPRISTGPPTAYSTFGIDTTVFPKLTTTSTKITAITSTATTTPRTTTTTVTTTTTPSTTTRTTLTTTTTTTRTTPSTTTTTPSTTTTTPSTTTTTPSTTTTPPSTTTTTPSTTTTTPSTTTTTPTTTTTTPTTTTTTPTTTTTTTTRTTPSTTTTTPTTTRRTTTKTTRATTTTPATIVTTKTPLTTKTKPKVPPPPVPPRTFFSLLLTSTTSSPLTTKTNAFPSRTTSALEFKPGMSSTPGPTFSSRLPYFPNSLTAQPQVPTLSTTTTGSPPLPTRQLSTVSPLSNAGSVSLSNDLDVFPQGPIVATTSRWFGMGPASPPWVYMVKPTKSVTDRPYPLVPLAHTAGGVVSVPMAIGIAAVIVVTLVLVGVAVHTIRKRRKARQDGLTEDSDVRYLKDGEIQFEFCDAAS